MKKASCKCCFNIHFSVPKAEVPVSHASLHIKISKNLKEGAFGWSSHTRRVILHPDFFGLSSLLFFFPTPRPTSLHDTVVSTGAVIHQVAWKVWKGARIASQLMSMHVWLSPGGVKCFEKAVHVFACSILFISASVSEVKPWVSADSFFLGSPR